MKRDVKGDFARVRVDVPLKKSWSEKSNLHFCSNCSERELVEY